MNLALAAVLGLWAQISVVVCCVSIGASIIAWIRQRRSQRIRVAVIGGGILAVAALVLLHPSRDSIQERFIIPNAFAIMLMILFLVPFVVSLVFLAVAVNITLHRRRPRLAGDPKVHPQAIRDEYKTYEDLQAALRKAGLESSNLIVGVDFTRSNTWTGQRTFGGRNLHDIALPTPEARNPYQSVIEIMGRTLEVFDDDKLIPAYGFGDTTTTDKAVFPFFPDRPCNGFNEVLRRYNEIVPCVGLAGPTSFAPLIYEAIKIVKDSGNSYHILVIVADGQITSEADTTKAIIEASNYPLSIITIGVGDGPWEQMEEYDDGLPKRKFDNFQFVAYNDILTKHDGSPLAFATAALQEIPSQFCAIKELKYL